MFDPELVAWVCDRCKTIISKDPAAAPFYQLSLHELYLKAAPVNIQQDLCELCALDLARVLLK